MQLLHGAIISLLPVTVNGYQSGLHYLSAAAGQWREDTFRPGQKRRPIRGLGLKPEAFLCQPLQKGSGIVESLFFKLVRKTKRCGINRSRRLMRDCLRIVCRIGWCQGQASCLRGKEPPQDNSVHGVSRNPQNYVHLKLPSNSTARLEAEPQEQVDGAIR